MSIDVLVTVWYVAIFAWAWMSISRLRANEGDWNYENWRRCQTCGELVRLDPDSLTPHLGHRLGPARYMSFFEYVKVMVGVL